MKTSQERMAVELELELELEREVRKAIAAAQERGVVGLHNILLRCEGADPRVVANLLGDGSSNSGSKNHPETVRRSTSELTARFPAADPISCQWWFTVDTVERLATRVFQSISDPDGLAAFVGSPTAAFQYSQRFGPAALFEIDPHVIAALRSDDRLSSVRYDVSSPPPQEHIGRYSAVLLDPPWYPEYLRAFLHRGLELARPGASLFCSIPPRLTRPGIIRERQELLHELLSQGVEIVALERDESRYLVPEFEELALNDIAGFDGQSWRAGDLLHIRKTRATKFLAPVVPASNVRPHARDARRFRFFFGKQSSRNKESPWLETIPDFERTLSRRKVDPAQLHWWTSTKKGGTLRDGEATEKAVAAWASGKSLEETVQVLRKGRMPPQDARSLCEELDRKVELWSRYGLPSARLESSGQDLAKERPAFASAEATGHPHDRRSEDGYRRPFQRDRDRVVWSRGLRQLANKTQVFPVTSDDFLRNRLTHSLEVAQLAGTIGASFGLDPHLIEAGALAHDVGHTPFGHAGEKALDILFDEIHRELGGFNHYEHGVDVVRWLEDAYQSPALGSIQGLNLSSEVAECIFKHTYCQSKDRFSQDELYKRSKHQKYFSASLCHVEGQAVRIADKVSYLISDLEDGIRMGVFSAQDLLGCRLLRRGPIDLATSPGESLHERFLAQRPLLVRTLMEDIIEATGYELARLGSIAAVRQAPRYAVNHSKELQVEVDEVWKVLQAGKLHRDARVRLANLHAARIVRELTLLFIVAPELVDSRFSEGHRRLHSSAYLEHYRGLAGPKRVSKKQPELA